MSPAPAGNAGRDHGDEALALHIDLADGTVTLIERPKHTPTGSETSHTLSALAVMPPSESAGVMGSTLDTEFVWPSRRITRSQAAAPSTEPPRIGASVVPRPAPPIDLLIDGLQYRIDGK